MGRDVPFDPEAKCDVCGKPGAFDFMGDYLCAKCAGTGCEDDKLPGSPEQLRGWYKFVWLPFWHLFF